MIFSEAQQTIILFGSLLTAYLVCLRLMLGPRRRIHPEYPFAGTVLLPGLFFLSKHLFDVFHLGTPFVVGAGVLMLGTFLISLFRDFSLLKTGFRRGILWLIKLGGIFLIVDFLLFYLTNIRLLASIAPRWYSLIGEGLQKLHLDGFSYHMFIEKKAWYEWVIGIDLGLSAVSFLEGIPAGIRLIRPRLPVLPTLIVMLLQLRTRKRTVYCPQCQKNLTFRDLVHFCPSCHKISTVKLMNPLGTVYVECENELCNFGKRRKFSRINPLSRRAIQGKIGKPGKKPPREGRRLRCKSCGSMLTLGNAFVTLSLFSDSPELIRDFRYEFVRTLLDPAKQNLSDPEKSRLVFKAAPDINNILENICSSGSTRRNIPLSPLRIALNYKSKSLDHAVLNLRTALKGMESNRLIHSEGILMLMGGKSRPTERQALAESLAMELDRLNTEAGAWKQPVLVGICADGCEELMQAVKDGFADAAEMEQRCIEYLESQSNDEILSTLGSVIDNIHYFIYTSEYLQPVMQIPYNIIPPVQAILFRKLPALKKFWAISEQGVHPSVTGQYRAK